MTLIHDLLTPAVLIDQNVLQNNIAKQAKMCREGGKKLRPHIKTHKCFQVAHMQIEAGADGLTVAKLGEAEKMAQAGFNDLFVANQLTGEANMQRLVRLVRMAHMRVGADSPETVLPLAEAMQRAGLPPIPLLIEVDTGLGRAGVRSVEECLQLARLIAECKGAALHGIFTHEGHIYAQEEADGRAELARQAAQKMRACAEALVQAGLPVQEISVGSTPGAPFMAVEPGVTEMRSGVYVYNDRTQLLRGTDLKDVALTVLATVVSVRPDGRIILDAGVKTLASDRNLPDGLYGMLPDYPHIRFAAASEEHGMLQADGPHTLKTGDRVRIVPNHCCTCVNMHSHITVHQGEQVTDTWEVALRGAVQ